MFEKHGGTAHRDARAQKSGIIGLVKREANTLRCSPIKIKINAHILD